MTDEIQQTPADAATEAAVEAHITGQTDKAAPLFKAAAAEHERSAPSDQTGADPAWRDGNDAPMPPPPAVTTETDQAIAKMTKMGGPMAALVTSWGSSASENLSYAREAFREMSINDPGLIAAVDKSGLGDHPMVLEHLARFARLSAGRSGDNHIANKRNDMTHSPRASAPARANSSAQNELNELMDANPPGTPSYAKVQNRIEVLSRLIAGSGSIVSTGGRNA